MEMIYALLNAFPILRNVIKDPNLNRTEKHLIFLEVTDEIKNVWLEKGEIPHNTQRPEYEEKQFHAAVDMIKKDRWLTRLIKSKVEDFKDLMRSINSEIDYFSTLR